MFKRFLDFISKFRRIPLKGLCDNCRIATGEPVHFDSNKGKYWKFMCTECLNDMVTHFSQLREMIAHRLEKM